MYIVNFYIEDVFVGDRNTARPLLLVNALNDQDKIECNAFPVKAKQKL